MSDNQKQQLRNLVQHLGDEVSDTHYTSAQQRREQRLFGGL
ncbi:hypothetical protein [Streptomyces sp. NPDC056723]